MYAGNEPQRVTMFEDTAIGTVSRFLKGQAPADVHIQRRNGDEVMISGSSILDAIAAGQGAEPLRTLIASLR